MKLSLFWKLFLAQLLAIALLMLGALSYMRLSAADSFRDYLRSQERASLEAERTRLLRFYEETGDWEKTVAALEEMGFGRPAGAPPPAPARMPRDGRPPLNGRPPPPPPFLAQQVRPHLLGPAGEQLLPREAAPLPRDSTQIPIEYDGKLLGYLAWPAPPRRVTDSQAEFGQRQARVFWVTSAAGLLIAAVLAAVTSGLMVRRIHRISAATAAFSRREFGARIAVSGGDELAQLSADFNRMAEALDAHEVRQRQWLADVAHELRTPLTILGGELEALLDGVRPADATALTSLRQEVQRLNTLVEDLNLLSLAESGALKLSCETVDVRDLIHDTAERFQSTLAKAGYSLGVQMASTPAWVKIDVQRFEQVLANLLNNVIRHAHPGAVSIEQACDTGSVSVRICDSGPGVSATQRQHLFDRFYQADASRDGSRPGRRGSGLGLAICKSIVEAHGGRILAEASAASGLCIRIELPLRT